MNSRNEFRFPSLRARANLSRRGFTLVELLVVIGILGLLMGMLLPAVQAVRESARNTTCLNNLRQLGIAFHNYESVTGRIPPSRGADEFLTWPVYLLPYLEKNNLYDRFDLSLPYYLQDSEAVQQVTLELLCPSRASRGSNISEREPKGAHVGAVGDYAGNAGSSLYFPGDWWALFHHEVDGVINSGFAEDNPVVDGLLPSRGVGRYRFSDITDGLSHTFFVGEKYVSVRGFRLGEGWGDGSIYNGDDPDTAMRIGGFGMRLAQNDNLPLSPGEYPIFGSAHPSHVNFLLGDGSVRSFAKSLDAETLYRLCSRNDGEPIDLD